MNAKKRLLKAMAKLLETTPIDQMTVGDITEEADISRQTFYRLYADKYELLKDFYSETVLSLYSDRGDFQSVYEGSYQTILYFKEHPNIMRNMFFYRDEFALALLSASFAYPGADLAEALVNGAFASDMEGSLADMGVAADDVARVSSAVRNAAAGIAAEDLLDAMRKDYTALFYGLGRFRIMSPYESVFKKLAVNPEARATAFLTKSTHDVEDAMRKHAALPENARREPADHFATELDFMRHLFTGVAGALVEGDEATAGEWRADAARFAATHVTPWIPSLFERTKAECAQPMYAALADFGLLVLSSVA